MADDIVTEAVNTLKEAIKDVPSVRRKTVYVYDQDDLLNRKKKLGFPAVGVVYVGLRGQEEPSKTGLPSDLILDVYLIGGDQCQDVEGTIKINSTRLLDQIRNAIKCKTLDSIGGRRKWQFVLESPIEFSESVLGYIQRWKTRVILTN